ncbi:hypothetical protein AVEN_211959-1 [Araneus ventricosus]|uniref:Uncharacterized protein n=1 Tax=Araneus ventricosus TaxID=182803 RepID=A0A4Y2FZS1_ARAVE|nr:hypothetical protein AVEN_211959-1 [Araneus ventricosus]
MNTLSEVQDNGFVQFVFDNSDHNTRTVDGHGTFHVMGGVWCVTPVSDVQTSSVEYSVQKFSPTWGPGPPFPTLAPPLIPRQKIIPTANIVGKFGFIPIVTHDWPKNHGLNRLVMEAVLSLKFPPMDAKIGTTGLPLDLDCAPPKSNDLAGPKSAEEPHTGWSGFMKNVAGKR